MAHMIRKAQSGIQNDLSSNITLSNFVLTSLTRIGISSRITKLAYDPIQSLLAAGTSSTKFGQGQIYVFGKGRIQATFQLPRKGASVKELVFCADKIVCVDDRGDLVILDLAEKRFKAGWSPPGKVTAIACDSALDYVLLGMSNGELLAYDMDRETAAPVKFPNFWTEHNPRAKILPVIALQFHPRDIGTLLIGYPEGAAVFSFKQNKALKFFQYRLPRGAPGGDADPSIMATDRSPKLTHALWHPTGTFVVTGHEDASLVFWDPRDGRVLMARSITDTNVDKPGHGPTMYDGGAGSFTPKTPILQIAWCANQDPDDTGVLIAGGGSAMMPAEGLTFIELGRTPTYTTSSWQLLSDHFEKPKRIHILPTPPNAQVANFCMIPRKSPWFNGAHDPIAILALLSSGEVATLSFPSGYPISPTNQLHVSMTFVHPFTTSISHSPVDRTRWLGMSENRTSGPPILRGGIAAAASLHRSDARNVISTAHADGTVRLWDAGHGDEIENPSALQADVARAIGRLDNVQITQVSLSAASGELAAGLRSGEIVVFRWGRNSNAGREQLPTRQNQVKALTNIAERKDPSLNEGFQPFTLLDQQDGACTALKVSDVGFIAAGFEGGSIVVIDLRGPAIIYNDNLDVTNTPRKSAAFLKKTMGGSTGKPTILEFSVMTIEDEDYSSILLHCGTDTGTIATFKILPDSSGRYTVAPAGSTSLDDRIVHLHPLNTVTGHPAYATPGAVASLRSGVQTPGVLVAISNTSIRIFRPTSARGVHRSFENTFCHAAGVTRCNNDWAIVGLFGDGTAKSLTIPGLKEIGSVKVGDILDVKRFGEAVVTGMGDVVAWTGPSEVAVMNVWGRPEPINADMEKLINPTLLIPPRPTISNFEWVSGTQYMTASDLDVLIGGPNRPPSKRLLAQTRADDAARRTEAARARSATASSSAAAADPNQEGYWEYMTRQVNERAERLGIVGDSMNSLQDNSKGWSDDVSKFVSKQKRGFLVGALKKGVGL